ncbi:hypothetical protein [Adlercreutzia murintestinalis]|uniref:hypothetical protein n=1 Tax=Adlercreutzia murintestinalis TaxID=2941325 RepID=UPI00203D7D6C|nr:hypothetical protein [Adlercreutzia murintestinalis]
MLPYFKKYSIIACIIGVLPSVVVSTVYPMVTGSIMASTLGGLAVLLALFMVSMVLGFNIMERVAETRTNGLLALYNDACDPEALIAQGKEVAEAVSFPCRAAGAWYMAYYAQALLEEGKVDQARLIEQGLRQSIQAVKKPQQKAGILVNLIPLADKLDGTEEALALVGQGLALVSGDAGPVAVELRAFLESQEKIMRVRESGHAEDAARLDEAIRASDAYPMRIRVEAAWAEARAYYQLGDAAAERRSLAFVVDHGNRLALVAKAQQRLASV